MATEPTDHLAYAAPDKIKVLILGGTGYIGSRLYQHLEGDDITVDTVDIELRGNNVNPKNHRADFANITAERLREYGTVILLAGHSNVAQSLQDPYGAFDNNLSKFTSLLSKLSGQRLIYASSSSVYTGVGGQVVDESWQTFRFMNMYDFTKYACDAVSRILYPNSYALRFGTVCGASANLRLDLMINRMVWSAITSGKIQMSNPQVHRPILGISDLCVAVKAIVLGPDQPGLYNLSSFNASVSEIAHKVADCLACKIDELPPSSTYDFSMESTKIWQVYSIKPTQTVETIVDELIKLHGGRDSGTFK